MALSADGRRLAVGGFLHGSDRAVAAAVRLYDFASGKLEALLKGHDDVVLGLDFSPDGKRLISSSSDKTAIIWDLTTRQQAHRLSGHSEAVKAVAFSKDGERAVTGSNDGTLRLWRVGDGGLIAEMTEHKQALRRDVKNAELWSAAVASVDVSAADQMIASGSHDGRILLWDGRTGAFVRQIAYPGGMLGLSAIGSLRFSPDGRWLLSASQYEGCQIYSVASGGQLYGGKLYDKPLTIFDKVDGAAYEKLRCNGSAVYSADGRLAGARFNNFIQLVDARTGRAIRTLQGSGTTTWAVAFAEDGRSIAWGDVYQDRPEKMADGTYKYQPTRRLRLPSAGQPLSAIEEIAADPAADSRPGQGTGKYIRGSRQHGSLSVAFKRAGQTVINSRFLEVSKDGRLQAEINLGEGGGAQSHSPITFTPDGRTILIGRTPAIQAYDLSGRLLGDLIGHDGMLRDLAPSPDGRFLVSGGGDQTVRLWNLETRELIASLFRASDGEWVMWTPQGYYASSPNGDRIVGWQINKGPDREAEYVAASQLRHRFYRPDIVERAIALRSAGKAVEESGGARDFQLADLAQRLPPKLSVLSPLGGSETMRGRAAVTLSLAEAADDPVKDFEVFVNDTKVAAAAKREGPNVSIEAPLGQGSNRIRVVARSKGDLLGEASLDITQNGEGALDKRDTLFIIAVGVDKYPQLKTCGPQQNAPCDLSFAGADAKAFAETVEKQMRGLHVNVVRRVLVNGVGGELEPTRDNIENAFDVLLTAKDNDTIAVFIAGHGHNDQRTGYQFLPTNARAGDSGNLASSSVIKWATLEGAIQAAKGRRLLFVDTCRAGSAYNARLIKDASDGGIVAYSATNTQQDALELPSLGHGVFTFALVKGLNGAADLAQEREVRVFDLGAFIEREVRKATNGRQTPDFYKKPGAENFVLVRM
jgi:WD40 repeat protein